MKNEILWAKKILQLDFQVSKVDPSIQIGKNISRFPLKWGNYPGLVLTFLPCAFSPQDIP